MSVMSKSLPSMGPSQSGMGECVCRMLHAPAGTVAVRHVPGGCLAGNLGGECAWDASKRTPDAAAAGLMELILQSPAFPRVLRVSCGMYHRGKLPPRALHVRTFLLWH